MLERQRLHSRADLDTGDPDHRRTRHGRAGRRPTVLIGSRRGPEHRAIDDHHERDDNGADDNRRPAFDRHLIDVVLATQRLVSDDGAGRIDLS